MAQVTMDSSEWKLMEENKILLEKSLQRERELSVQIDQLNKEKIDVLKKAEKQVIITTRKEIKEYVVESNEAFNNLSNLIESYETFKSMYRHYGNMPSVIGSTFDSFKNKIFKIKKTENSAIEEYSYKGLDDVVSEIRSQIKSEIDSDVAKTLAKFPELNSEIERLLTKNRELFSESASLSAKLSEMEFHHNELKQMLTCHLWQDTAIFKIKDILKTTTIWNISKKIKEIFELIETKPPIKLMFGDKI